MCNVRCVMLDLYFKVLMYIQFLYIHVYFDGMRESRNSGLSSETSLPRKRNGTEQRPSLVNGCMNKYYRSNA
jgi:hypothetical protein